MVEITIIQEYKKIAVAVEEKCPYSAYLCKDGEIRTPMRGDEDWFDNLSSAFSQLAKYVVCQKIKVFQITIINL